MNQSGVDCHRPFVTDDQAAEVIQPRVGALDNPSSAITTQAAPILMRGPTVTGAGGNDGLDAPGIQGGPHRIAIVAAVGNQPVRSLTRTPGTMRTGDAHGGQGRVQQGYLCRG